MNYDGWFVYWTLTSSAGNFTTYTEPWTTRLTDWSYATENTTEETVLESYYRACWFITNKEWEAFVKKISFIEMYIINMINENLE